MAERQTSGAAITFQNLGKSFDKKGSGQVMALEGVTLDVPAGTITGIIGRSGAGKSTLLRMVNGLEQPTSGTVTVAGHDVGRAGAAELRRIRRDVGMIFQHFNLLSSRTVYGNVALPLEIADVPSAEIKRRVDDLIARVGLQDLSRRYPAELSGGQKQRIALARAFFGEPRFVVLDEPNSNLDSAGDKALARKVGVAFCRHYGLSVRRQPGEAQEWQGEWSFLDLCWKDGW